MRLQNRCWQSILVVALSCVISVSAHAANSIQIAAAASFTDVFNNTIIPAFTKKTGITVLPTYGATGLLAKQIENGAPYEVFVAADTTTAPRLAKENLIPMDSIEAFAVGRLVIWSKTLPVDKEGMSILALPVVSTISVANPKTAPYGNAAIVAITDDHMYALIMPKIVYGENVNQAFQYAKSGNADVAFTAYSLAKNAGGHVSFVPQYLYDPLEQSVSVTSNASPAAKKFEDFLLSKEAQKMLVANGYLLPSKVK